MDPAMGNNNLILKLRDINFQYPAGKQVLHNLNLDFEKGERMGLTGPNGSGKTTLFYLILGLLQPDSGIIKIFDKPRTKESDFRGVRRRIGLMFQNPDDQLFCPTVEEDVAFGPLNLGKTRDEALFIVEGILDKIGLSGFGNRITYELSGGEKKLVALAAVLAMEPEVLLLDEPFAGLDRHTSECIVSVLKKSALSYIIISHDQEFLEKTVHLCYEIKHLTQT